MHNNRKYVALIDAAKIVDLVVIVVTAFLAYYLRFIQFKIELGLIGSLFSFVILYYICMYFLKGYANINPIKLRYGFGKIFMSIVMSVGGVSFLAFLLKVSTEFSRLWGGYWFVLMVSGILLGRFLLVTCFRWIGNDNIFYSKVLILEGESRYARAISNKINQNIFAREVFKVSTFRICLSDIEKNITNAIERMQNGQFDIVVLACSDEEFLSFKSHIGDFHQISTDFYRAPTQNMFLTSDTALEWSMLNGFPMAILGTAAYSERGWWMKICYDYVIASIALVLLSPILLTIALLIKMTSEGPVLFEQYRQGINGKPFKIYKFRSMRLHEEKKGDLVQATAGDPRITTVGRFIRRTSLDELPQLINILKGEMSLVGPRPHAIQHNEIYKGRISYYLGRHRVKPGLTGLAQIHGFRGETDTDFKMEMRVKYDIEYIQNWSVFLDLKILFLTIFLGFFNKNAV